MTLALKTCERCGTGKRIVFRCERCGQHVCPKCLRRRLDDPAILCGDCSRPRDAATDSRLWKGPT